MFLAHGRRISIRQVQRRFAAWFAMAGIDQRTVHSLRHSFACRLLAKTGNLALVQSALGHASIASTCVYARIDRSAVRAALSL